MRAIVGCGYCGCQAQRQPTGIISSTKNPPPTLPSTTPTTLSFDQPPPPSRLDCLTANTVTSHIPLYTHHASPSSSRRTRRPVNPLLRQSVPSHQTIQHPDRNPQSQDSRFSHPSLAIGDSRAPVGPSRCAPLKASCRRVRSPTTGSHTTEGALIRGRRAGLEAEQKGLAVILEEGGAKAEGSTG